MGRIVQLDHLFEYDLIIHRNLSGMGHRSAWQVRGPRVGSEYAASSLSSFYYFTLDYFYIAKIVLVCLIIYNLLFYVLRCNRSSLAGCHV